MCRWCTVELKRKNRVTGEEETEYGDENILNKDNRCKHFKAIGKMRPSVKFCRDCRMFKRVEIGG